VGRRFSEANVRRDKRGQFASKAGADAFTQRISDRIGASRGEPKRLTEDEQDLADELTDNGAEVHPDGTVTVYHFTTPTQADQIRRTGSMRGLEDGLFFTTRNDEGQGGGGRGGAGVELRIPLGKLLLDDVLGDEAHVRIPLRRAGETMNVGSWIQKGSGRG
jgi:hypothetical protein